MMLFFKQGFGFDHLDYHDILYSSFSILILTSTEPNIFRMLFSIKNKEIMML